MTTADGYLDFIASVATPSAEDRSRASRHRDAIETRLKDRLGVFRIFETGSWSHGTAVSPWSDVDYFASMPGVRPQASADNLEEIRSALAMLYPALPVQVDHPAVSIRFAEGPNVEILPAHITGDDDYFIPDPDGTGWIKSSPLKHKEYVDGTRDLVPDTKKFIRLIKEWNYKQGAAISSLYLEMRAAKHIRDNRPFIFLMDLAWFFRDLDRNSLAPMNDPSRFDGRRIEASKAWRLPTARQAVHIAAEAARIADEANRAGNHHLAVEALRVLYES